MDDKWLVKLCSAIVNSAVADEPIPDDLYDGLNHRESTAARWAFRTLLDNIKADMAGNNLSSRRIEDTLLEVHEKQTITGKQKEMICEYAYGTMSLNVKAIF